jgi:hypothetical protein
MIIKKVDIWHLNCKFRYPFKHKLATHTGSDNLVVRLTTNLRYLRLWRRDSPGFCHRGIPAGKP